MYINWNGCYPYDYVSVGENVSDAAGVYKIGILEDKEIKVCYVGQAENLKKRLKEHLNVNGEPNDCLAKHIDKYACYYKFALVAQQEDRDSIEMALYLNYKSECNNPAAIPNAPDIEVNFN